MRAVDGKSHIAGSIRISPGFVLTVDRSFQPHSEEDKHHTEASAGTNDARQPSDTVSNGAWTQYNVAIESTKASSIATKFIAHSGVWFQTLLSMRTNAYTSGHYVTTQKEKRP